MAKKILVIDDSDGLRKAVVKVLSQEGFFPIEAANGSDGLLLAGEAAPDLILTDAEMPGLGGHALCRAVKKSPALSQVPVVIMSGELVEEKDVIAGLDGGADDYITKPFTLRILLSRVRAVLRRYSASADVGKKLLKHGWELDPAGRTVKVRGREIPMTRKEFDLLAVLAEKAGRVLSVPFLLETVWGYDPADYNDPGTVEVHVSHLRKKLGPALAKRLVNVHGRGYKYDDSTKPAGG